MTTALTTRITAGTGATVKGSPLTSAEIDNNFISLNDNKLEGIGSSSITTLGTVTTGTWNASVITGQYGGTGVANTSKTITLGGNLVTSGAYATTLTATNTTNVTLPTTGTLATLAGTETFTNKTLTSPVIETIVNSGTLTLPTSTDTLVGKATTDTLTNKTLTSPVIATIVNSGTLTLPTSTDTLVGRATTDTLTNKTLTGAILNGTLGATTPSTVAGTTGIFSSQVCGVTTVSDHGIRVTAPSGDATPAIFQFTNFAKTVELVSLNATANTLTVTASTGLVCSGNVTAYSDTRIKNNLKKINSPLEKIEQLNGYTFDRTDIVTSRQTGLLAQEVLKVLPEAVIGSEDTIYSVAYGNLMGLMVEAIKELNAKISKLENK